LLKRLELIQLLIRLATYGHYANTTIGVVVPDFGESKRFSKDFDTVLNEVPIWLRPHPMVHTMRGIAFENNFSIFLLSNPNHVKGRTLNYLYASSRMTSEELSPYCFLALKGQYETFIDE
jgi:hypothetical protein